MEIVVVMVVAAILGGIIASRKGRSAGGWALLSFLIPIAVLVLLALPPLTPATVMVTPAPSGEPEKTCPKCAERVKAAALVCRFCGHDFEAKAASPA